MPGNLPTNEPVSLPTESASIELVIDGRPRDLGGLSVRRVLPSLVRRHLGPFVFFDHMGPATWPVGSGMDVRPHPHVCLATVTYLFDGEIDHRDSLGTFRTIRPGDVNWMLAGRGIAHSERTSPSARAREGGAHLHGIQSWVALPTKDEEIDPAFEHHPAAAIPRIERPGLVLDVAAGTAFGHRSPVGVRSPTLYVHAKLDANVDLTIDTEHEERAVYVVTGSISCDARTFGQGTLVVLRSNVETVISTGAEPARLMLIGGARLDGERHIWWNFVSSSLERIEKAKDDWRSGRFAKVPGDDIEFIPLPDSSH